MIYSPNIRKVFKKLPFGGQGDENGNHSDKPTDSDDSDIVDEEILGYKHGKPIELPEVPHPPPLEQPAPQRHRYDNIYDDLLGLIIIF